MWEAPPLLHGAALTPWGMASGPGDPPSLGHIRSPERSHLARLGPAGGTGGMSTWQLPRLCSASRLQTQLTPAAPLLQAGQAADAAASILGSKGLGQ